MAWEAAPEGSVSETVEPGSSQSVRLDWSKLEETPLKYANATSVAVDHEQGMFYLTFGEATVRPATQEAMAKRKTDDLPAITVRPVGYIALNPYVMTSFLTQMQATHRSFAEHLEGYIDQMEAEKSAQ